MTSAIEKAPLRIMLVDDSRLYRAFLKDLLEAHPDLRVVAEASHGQEALDMVAAAAPNLVIMDVLMPIMDGITAVSALLDQYPVPILVHTSAAGDSSDSLAFDALRAGALDVLPKPDMADPNQRKVIAEDLPQRVRSLARIRVMRKQPRNPPRPPHSVRANYALAIGASTGGPMALAAVLKGIPPPFPAPILVVQHISHGFLEGLIHWLARETGHRVKIAEHGEPALPGIVYFAPTQVHALLAGGRILLDEGPARNGCRPSADVLFESLCELGLSAVAVVLTGMGADGAEGAARLHRSGGLLVVQSPATCAVAGMPNAAIEAVPTATVADLDHVGEAVLRLTTRWRA